MGSASAIARRLYMDLLAARQADPNSVHPLLEPMLARLAMPPPVLHISVPASGPHTIVATYHRRRLVFEEELLRDGIVPPTPTSVQEHPTGHPTL